jgi:predicted transcriptional regulator of viral defense system
MNYFAFSQLFEKQIVVDIRNAELLLGKIDRRRLYEWQQKGYIQKIVNNFYIRKNADIAVDELKIIANQIYQPSYVSLHSALSFYNFIPEAVFQVTSVTTRRNQSIETCIGHFSYRTVKQELFFGYDVMSVNSGSYFLADPQKALLDYLYFLPHADNRKVLEAVRFNALEMKETIDGATLKSYLELFRSPKISRAINVLRKMEYVEF